MKLKLLTMLFAIGLFAVGAGVNAQTTVGTLSQTQSDDAANQIIEDLKAGGFGEQILCTLIQHIDTKCKTCSTLTDAATCIKNDKDTGAQIKSICDQVGAYTVPVVGPICKIPGDIGKHSTSFLKLVCCNLKPASEAAEACIKAGGESCAAPVKPCKPDCKTGYNCVDGSCVSPKCTKDADCPKGQTCDTKTGKCSAPAKVCTPACAAKETCVNGVCMCGKGKACPKGQTCDGTKCNAPAKVCTPACAVKETCVNGVCMCGKGKACPKGQTCDGTKCNAPAKTCKPACINPSVCDPTKGTCVCGPNKITCKSGDTCQTVSKGVKCCNAAKSNCYQ